MPHSIFAKFQPVSQRIVPDPAHRARRLRMDPLLFLPYAPRVQPVGFDGLEAVRNRRPSLSSRLRFTGRSVGFDPEMVVVDPNSLLLTLQDIVASDSCSR